MEPHNSVSFQVSDKIFSRKNALVQSLGLALSLRQARYRHTEWLLVEEFLVDSRSNSGSVFAWLSSLLHCYKFKGGATQSVIMSVAEERKNPSEVVVVTPPPLVSQRFIAVPSWFTVSFSVSQAPFSSHSTASSLNWKYKSELRHSQSSSMRRNDGADLNVEVLSPRSWHASDAANTDTFPLFFP